MRDPIASLEHEFYGDLDCRRGEERLALRLKMVEVGRNVCFGGKGGGSAPSPDPQIGQAALMNAQVGQEWLDFARQQFDEGNNRQAEIDALGNRLTERQIETIDRSTQWAQEDRNIAADYRAKYDQWADEDRQVGKEYREKFAQMGEEALGEGKRYQGIFDNQATNQYDFAKRQQDRYEGTYQPMEEQFAQDAKNWDSADRQAKMASEARADVMNNAASQQQQQQRQMAAMGVDPRSGRFAAVDRATGLQTALSAAGAQNAARDNVRTQGMALRGQAIDMGRGVQQMSQQANQLGMQATGAGHSAFNQGMNMNMQANNLGLAASGIGNTSAALGMGNQGAGYQGLGLGVNAGQAAMNTTLGANSAWGANNAIMGQGFQGAMQGYSNQAGILNQQYGNQLQAWAAQKQADSQSMGGLFGGVGGIMGGLGSMAAGGLISSKEKKESKRPAKGALKAVESMPVEKWKYKDGVADGGEHIGPYAEDFKKTTGLGDGKTINIVDAIGLNMKATQELSQKVDKLANQKRA